MIVSFRANLRTQTLKRVAPCWVYPYIWKIHEPLKVDLRIRIMRRNQTNEIPITMDREISRPIPHQATSYLFRQPPCRMLAALV